MGGYHLAAQFEKQLDQHPDRECLVFGDRRLTYAQVAAEAENLSAALTELGLGLGDRVAVDLPNRPEWVVSLLAVARIGAVIVPLNPSLSYHELKYQLRHAEVGLCVIPQEHDGVDYLELFDGMMDELPDLKRVVTVGSEERWHEDPVVSYQDLLARGKVDGGRRSAGNLDPAVAPLALLYTPGTLGKYKGVVLTHENLVWTAIETNEALQLVGSDRVLGAVPLSTVFGVHIVVSTLVAGGTIVLQERFDPREALDLIEREKLSIVHGVPTMFRLLMRDQTFESRDLGSVRTGIVAGSPVSRELARTVRRWNDVQIAYGLTETGPTVSITRFEDPADKREQTVGRPLESVAVKLVEAKSNQVDGKRQVGELAVVGPNVMTGYYRMPHETEKCLTSDGYLLTGDLATIDEAGFLSIVGRTRQMIIRGGYNIFPREVEDVVRTHPAVDQVSVVGVPNEILGELVCACVIPVEGAIVTGEEIKDFARDQLAEYKTPDVVRFIETLPVGEDGNVDREALTQTVGLETS